MNLFNFEFFRDLYEELESPIIYDDEENEDCQFFAWNSEGKAHYSNLKEVFNMPMRQWKMLDNYKPWYVGWANCDEKATEIMRQHYETPFFLPEDSAPGKKD